MVAGTKRERLDRGKVGSVNGHGCSPGEKDKGVRSLSSRKGEEKNEQESWIGVIRRL